MADQARVNIVADQATQVMRQRFGGDMTARKAVVVAERGRSLVVRCSVAPQPGIPRSFIAKQHTGDAARGFSDWASLAFLSALDGAYGVAPRFYGGLAAASLIVMEDLGGARSLADVIDAGDVAAIRGTLQALAKTMARLVAITAEPALAARFERLRNGLPGCEEVGRRHEAMRWRAAWPKVAAWFAALNVPAEGALEDSAACVADSYAEPGAFLAFSHGDPAPSNNHVGPDATRLLDFEYGAYRHALYDVTGWYILCPLPEAWAEEMHRVFRQHLAGSLAVAADESAYRDAWATMCAYRALAMLSWLPLDIMGKDRPWVDAWRAAHSGDATASGYRGSSGSRGAGRGRGAPEAGSASTLARAGRGAAALAWRRVLTLPRWRWRRFAISILGFMCESIRDDRRCGYTIPASGRRR